MSLPSSGPTQIQISGTLADMLANLQAFINDLVAQGVDPTPIKNASVIITINLPSVTQANFANVNKAITAWRTQTAGTSIVVAANFTLQV